MAQISDLLPQSSPSQSIVSPTFFNAVKQTRPFSTTQTSFVKILKAQLDSDKTQLRALVKKVQDAEKLRPGDAWFSLIPYNVYLQGHKRQKDVYS